MEEAEIALREEAPKPELPPEGSELITIFETYDDTQLALIKSLLIGQRIFHFVENEYQMGRGKRQYKIKVISTRVKDAAQLIKDFL